MGPHWIASKKNLAFGVSPGFECVNVREISSDGRHLGSIAGKLAIPFVLASANLSGE